MESRLIRLESLRGTSANLASRIPLNTESDYVWKVSVRTMGTVGLVIPSLVTLLNWLAPQFSILSTMEASPELYYPLGVVVCLLLPFSVQALLRLVFIKELKRRVEDIEIKKHVAGFKNAIESRMSNEMQVIV